MPVQVLIPSLGNKYQDYRDPIPGDSYNWGPVINANKIKNFTFHHSVTAQTAKNDGNWKAECDKIAQLHLARGWAGIGYRFVICSDGTVAYVGDLSHGGSAVTNMNDVMFSACWVGDFTKELPTAYQVHSAHLLAKHFLTQMPQYPNLKDWSQIQGHKFFNPTACPGSNWPNDLRDRVLNNNFSGYPNPQPSQPVPPVPIPPTPPTIDYKVLYEAEVVKTKDLTSQLATVKNQVVTLNEKITKAVTALA